MKLVRAIGTFLVVLVAVFALGELEMYTESLMTVKTDFYFIMHRCVNCLAAILISSYLSWIVYKS